MSSGSRETLTAQHKRVVDQTTLFLELYPQFTTSLVRAMAFDNSEMGIREWLWAAAHTVWKAGDPQGYLVGWDAELGPILYGV